MEAATSSSSKTRNTVYVSNIPNNADVQQILDAFVTFGELPCTPLLRLVALPPTSLGVLARPSSAQGLHTDYLTQVTF